MKFFNSKYAVAALKNPEYKRLHVLQCFRDRVNVIIYDFRDSIFYYDNLQYKEVLTSLAGNVCAPKSNYFIIFTPDTPLRINGKLTTMQKYVSKTSLKAFARTQQDLGYIKCLNNSLNSILSMNKYNYSFIKAVENVSNIELNGYIPYNFRELVKISLPIAHEAKNYTFMPNRVINANIY